jgi:hypothetical protein
MRASKDIARALENALLLDARAGLFVSCDQRFFDPIILPGGKPLITLRDAALYITKLPKAGTMPRNGRPQWRRSCWLLNMTGQRCSPG